MRTFQAMKGKYELKWVTGVFKDMDEALAAVASGAGEMTLSGPNYMVQLDSAWEAPNGPGVFDSWEHFKKTMRTPAWQEVHQKMAKEKNVTIIKWVANMGAWYLYTSKGPVKSMQDLKEQKIRFAGGEAFSKGLQAMGATAINLPYTEVVTGLQTRMIDGLLTDFFAAQFFYNLPRYTKYAVNVPWAIVPACFVANSKWWNSLPEKDKTAIKDVFDRINTSEFFEETKDALAQAWDADPQTELVNFPPEETKRMKAAMLAGSADTLRKLDPKLVQAIESSR
jgi:TRAP-type C4-dicarboxylate transport system substrate-binding protein